VQGFALFVVLPVARQLPALHAAHEATEVTDKPPALNLPAGQGKAVAEPVPVGQKWPAWHSLWVGGPSVQK